jgi:hypothetical protein
VIVRRWDGWLARIAAAVVAVLASSAAPATTELDPLTTASHYMVSVGAEQNPDDRGYQIGCADGRVGRAGLRLLLFGTQEADGRLRPPGTTRSSPVPRVAADWAARAAAGWMRGFTECGTATALLALGVNNKSDGGADPARAGAEWAGLVTRVAEAAPPGRVTVGGALDGEPGWSDARWARAWVDAYVHATTSALYAAGSADGCPTDPSTEACARGWTVPDLFHISTGAARTVAALPQIYRTDGIQARQWAAISAWGVRSGWGPLRVVGVLTQQTACRQVSGCARTANAPRDAVAQLTQALAADPATRVGVPLVATDIDWSSPPPSP